MTTKLRWNDYYPDLGGKLITIKTDLDKLKGKRVQAVINKTSEDRLKNLGWFANTKVEPVGDGIINDDGEAQFRFTGKYLRPEYNNTSGINEVILDFYVESDDQASG